MTDKNTFKNIVVFAAVSIRVLEELSGVNEELLTCLKKVYMAF